MGVQAGGAAEEVKCPQRCINDLVSLFALPAMWIGAAPSRNAEILLDALLRMVQPALVCVRVRDQGGRAPIEIARFAQSQKQGARPREIGEILKHWLEADAPQWPPQIPNSIGHGDDLSIIAMGLGLQGEIGVMVAGSERSDFPRLTERLILSVAANQAPSHSKRHLS